MYPKLLTMKNTEPVHDMYTILMQYSSNNTRHRNQTWTYLH